MLDEHIIIIELRTAIHSIAISCLQLPISTHTTMKRFFLLLTILTIFSVAFSTSLDTLHLTVIAPSGLSLRSEPGLQGERLAVVPQGTELILIGQRYELFTHAEFIDQRYGSWVKARYAGKEGYLFSGYLREHPAFVSSTDINRDFRITSPGTRCLAVNYDPTLNWYAFQLDKETGNIFIQSTSVDVQTGIDLAEEEMDFALFNSSEMSYIKPRNASDVLLLMGVKDPLAETIPQSKSYINPTEDNQYSPGGKFVFPYEYVKVGEVDGIPYYLTAREDVRIDSIDTHSPLKKTYQLYLTQHNQGLSAPQTTDLSSEVDADVLSQFDYGTYHGLRLLWQGDINGDTFPDLLFYSPSMYQTSGGHERFHLLVSEKTETGYSLKRVARDIVQHCFGC